MKLLAHLVVLFVLSLPIAPAVRAANADSPELLQARNELVDQFKSGRTDEDARVKQLRAKIAALEFIAQNSPASSDSTSRLITVNFPGGPFSALVESANKNNPTGFNVIGEKADLTLELPPFSLRNADAGSLAYALDGLLLPRGYTLSEAYQNPRSQFPVFTLRKLSAFDRAGRASNQAQRYGQFQSFQLNNYLGAQTVDDIVGAIRAAWELDPLHDADALRLKFHPPTGILLVSGPNEGVALVQTVLTQLRREPGEIPPPNAPTETSNARGARGASPRAEQQRLNDVATETMRRRQERDAATPKAAPTPVPPSDKK